VRACRRRRGRLNRRNVGDGERKGDEKERRKEMDKEDEEKNKEERDVNENYILQQEKE
jgi:hypothetical protein